MGSQTERLTEHRRGEMALKYGHLNSMLTEIREIDQKIADLKCQISRLDKERNELHDKFHREVIKVEPTEVIDLKKKTSSTTTALPKDQLEKLLKAAKNDPAIQEQVCKLLGIDYVVVT